MKFILYPNDPANCTAEYSGNPEFKKEFYEQFKKFSAGLTKQSKGDRAAAAVAIQLYARGINCKVEFERNRTTGYIDKVVIASSPEEP